MEATEAQPTRQKKLTQTESLLSLNEGTVPCIRFQELPRYHATLRLRQGVSPKVVQERLGHATPASSLHVHRHVLPGSMQREAAAGCKNANSPGAVGRPDLPTGSIR
jgi:integrase